MDIIKNLYDAEKKLNNYLMLRTVKRIGKKRYPIYKHPDTLQKVIILKVKGGYVITDI